MTRHDPQTHASATADTETNGLSRRDFLKSSGGLTLGIALGGLMSSHDAQASGTYPGLVTSWLNVSPSNGITLTVGIPEMGQGSRSGLAQILAEDLMVDPTKIAVVQGATTVAYAGSAALSKGYATSVGGSSAVRNNFWALRDAATRAREMLVQAAMDANLSLYGVSDTVRSNYSVANGVITYTPTGSTFTYGSVADAASLKVSTDVAPDGPVRVIGTSIPRLDIPAKLNGTALFGIDVVLPNMVFAVVKHCPTLGGKLASNPAVPAGTLAAVPLKVYDFVFPEPTKNYASNSIMKISRGLEASGDTNAVAVVATETWTAMTKAAALSASWTLPAGASSLNDAQFLSDAQALATQSLMPSSATGSTATSLTSPAQTLYTCEGVYATDGSGNSLLTGATPTVSAQYSLPYVAHAAMEVLSCVVDYKPGVSCTVYSSTQSPQAVMKLVYLLLRQLGDTAVAPMSATGVWDTSRIQVSTQLIGGGFGRKIELDFVSQALQVAVAISKLAAGPRPVKLIWPREQDFARDQYRPMGYVSARATLSGTGNNATIAGWEYRVISPSIGLQRGAVLNTNPALGIVGDSQGSEGARELPYAMGSSVSATAPGLPGGRLTEYVTHPSQVPLGYWRSVGASINVFAVESLIDELAVAAGADPYQFRRNLLLGSISAGASTATTAQRWLNVLDMAANLGKWGSPAAGNFQGIAIGSAFNSTVAIVAEISVTTTKNATTGVTTTTINPKKISVALDSYLVVNPDAVIAQMQGGVALALNAALYGRQSFVNGVPQRQNFNTYRVIRAASMPDVAVSFVQNASPARSAVIGGVGELGVPALAPALAAAFYRATGTRQRTLPFYP